MIGTIGLSHALRRVFYERKEIGLLFSNGFGGLPDCRFRRHRKYLAISTSRRDEWRRSLYSRMVGHALSGMRTHYDRRTCYRQGRPAWNARGIQRLHRQTLHMARNRRRRNYGWRSRLLFFRNCLGVLLFRIVVDQRILWGR